MIEGILATLDTLREAARRSTLVCTFALAAGVIMIPLSYRGGVERFDRWLLVGFGMAYVAAAALRVARGLSMERQIESEERFVRQAARDGLGAPVKIGRPSTLVHAMRRIESVPAADRRRALHGALRRSTQRLVAPPGSVALPALILLGGLWIRVALGPAGHREATLLFVVVGTLGILFVLEAWLLALRHRLRRQLDALAERVVAWWSEEQDGPGPATFTHRILYRDVAERLGLVG